jgi:carboxyl-terminal processing protease
MKFMKIVFSLLAVHCSLFAAPLHAADLFDLEAPVVEGVRVHEASDVFAEIFEKLDAVKFGGKDIRAALESLETLSPKVRIAATDSRIVIVRGDDIIGNWPRPLDRDWRGFGQIATALLLKMRAADAGIARQSQSALYSMAVAAMTRGLDASGRYVASIADEGRVLTSAGLEGGRDSRGYWRVSGVVKGSQADAAGINDGDLIVEINGANVAKLSNAELSAAFAGLNSGTLKLKAATPSGVKNIILRRASVVMTDADVVYRAEIRADKSNGEIQKAEATANILEIIIHNISENSVAIANEALSKYKDANGIILDLRAARGGDEKSAAKLAGLFLGRAPVMRIDEGGGEELEVIPGGDAATDAPVAVLVSGGTSGAAEAVALALGDNDRGILIGTPTAGSARLVTKIELSNGGVIELGNRVIKSGRGANIDGRGVFPLVCLSSIRGNDRPEAFFINDVNGHYNA